MTEGRNRRGYLGVWSPRGIAAIASYLAPKLMILVIFETGKNVEIMIFFARAGGRSPPAFGGRGGAPYGCGPPPREKILLKTGKNSIFQ